MNDETVDPRTIAGEVILAIADDDGEKLARLLAAVATGEVPVAALVVQLATVAQECMRLVAGDEWRDVLNLALLSVSVEGAGE